MITMQIQGLKELDAALASLPKAVATAALRTALKKAGQPVADAAEANAAAFVKTGKFEKSFVVKTTLSKRQRRLRGTRRNEAVMFIGSTDKKAHLLEFGTAPHVILPKRTTGEDRRKSVLASASKIFGFVVSHPGTPPKPTLRPAWDSQRETVLKTLGQLLWEQIRKAQKRLAVRGRQ